MAKEIATFAGGCFWCMVKPFDSQPGIESVVSGYTGGHKENPTYKEVCSGTTGHTEAVQITFDPEVFPYEKLVEVYWQQTDPTDAMGQFVDRGDSYRPVIFYHSEEQRKIAEASKAALQASGRFKKDIVTKIEPQVRSILQKNITKISTRRIQNIIKRYRGLSVATLLSTVFGNKEKS